MKTKEMKGITLIALVITIVVLMILAGVSINTVLGDDGIIQKAKEAAEATKRASAEEEICLRSGHWNFRKPIHVFRLAVIR